MNSCNIRKSIKTNYGYYFTGHNFALHFIICFMVVNGTTTYYVVITFHKIFLK